MFTFYLTAKTSVMLGAGRETKDSEIDYTAGIIIEKKTGDYVKKGERIAVFPRRGAGRGCPGRRSRVRPGRSSP